MENGITGSELIVRIIMLLEQIQELHKVMDMILDNDLLQHSVSYIAVHKALLAKQEQLDEMKNHLYIIKDPLK